MIKGACKVIAHRGFSSIAPENTVSSIRAAISSGADYCEFDVRSVSSGEVVLFHDEKVDRTTDGKGKLPEFSLSDVRGLDAGAWKDVKYTGERVPTLDEALVVFKAKKCLPVVEIKDERVVEAVVNLLEKHSFSGIPVVLAFDEKIIRAVVEKTSKARCAWLCARYPEDIVSDGERVEWLTEHAESCGVDMLNLRYGMLSEEIVKALHERGITVWCWTVNDVKTMKEMLEFEVDGIATDYPDQLKDLAQRKEN